MHWDNGKFHKDLIVGKNIYLTDYKFNGISGSISAITFGDPTVRSNLYGKNIVIETEENTILKANDIYIESAQNIKLNAGNAITISSTNYGTTLPTTGNSEGRIFFKLIS